MTTKKYIGNVELLIRKKNNLFIWVTI